MTLRLPVFALLVLAACSGDDPELMNFAGSRTGPDEFLVAPSKPLETPPTTALVVPTPGGTNRADPTPNADAIIALGGNPRSASGTAIPAGDSGIVSYASRDGRDSQIRQVLAAEDLEYRRNNNGLFLERVANVNVYYRAYADQSLNQSAELQRFRNAGYPTASAPPALIPETIIVPEGDDTLEIQMRR